MRKTIKSLVAIAFLTGIGSTSFAQTLGEDVTLEARALILRQIQITLPEDIRFGAVSSGNIAILAPQDSTDNRQVSARAEPGKFVVFASKEQPIGITWPATIDMAYDDGVNPIHYVTYQPKVAVAWGEVTSNYFPQALLISNNPAIADLTAHVTFGNVDGTGVGGQGYFTTKHPAGADTEKATFFIGGQIGIQGDHTVAIPNTQATGTYEANVTFDITYYAL